MLKQASDHLNNGDLNVAERLSRKLLQEDPAYMGALQILGVVSLKKENFQQAVDCFVAAAAHAPDDWKNFLNLGLSWIGLEKLDMANMVLREAIRLNPDNAEAHRLLGEAAMGQNKYQAAISWLEAAIARDRKDFKAMFKLADCHMHLGNVKASTELLVSIYRERPELIAVLQRLHNAPPGLIDIDFANAIRKTETGTGLQWGDSVISRQFLSAAILDRAGENERAWNLLKEANSTVHKNTRDTLQKAKSGMQRQLDAAKSAIISTVDQSSQGAEPAPLFLIGVSRSGKTTLETLLSCHPAIARGFESKRTVDASVRASQVGGLPNISNLDELPVQLFGAFAKHFCAQLKRQAPDKLVVTETSPANAGVAAQLASALPNARFVFVTRDRDDLAVRIFMTYYDSGNMYAYDIDEIYWYIDWYEQMTEILLTKIGDRAVHIRYEDMASDPYAIANSVFELCGLDGSGISIDPIGNDVGAALPYKAQLDQTRKKSA